MGEIAYLPAFDLFWKAYGSVPNSSKTDAAKAFNQVAKLMPSQDILLSCVESYKSFLSKENASRAKRNQGAYPQAHAATWLRQQRWESFMDEAKLRLEQKARAEFQR